MAITPFPLVVGVLTLLFAITCVSPCDDNLWWQCRETFKYNESGSLCNYIKFTAHLEIKLSANETVTEVVPESADVANGMCFNGSNESYIQLSWQLGSRAYKLTFAFVSKDVGSSPGALLQWSCNEISIVYNSSGHVGAARYDGTLDEGIFEQEYFANYYYFCNHKMTYAMNSNVTVYLSFVRMFPYMDPGDAKKLLCVEDAKLEGQLVPIVVGAVIGFLMVLIFMVYLIAYVRRKIQDKRLASYVPLSNEM